MGDGLIPWRAFQPEGSPEELVFDERSLYDAVRQVAERHPELPAYDFLGTTSTYRSFLADIDRTAAAFASLGIGAGDVMTICLPNCPQALFAFYALNKVGAVASMIHPLSVSEEIRTFLDISKSTSLLTLDAFWPRVAPALEGSTVRTALHCRIQEHMPPLLRTVFVIAKGRKIKPVPRADGVRSWDELMKPSRPDVEAYKRDVRGLAVILYSGGTTGTPKGIMLSDWNFNALTQALNWQLPGGVAPGDKVLAILPLFHGFGLGVTANLFLTKGGCCLLVPKFSADEVVKVLLKKAPQIIAGVPTLFEALSVHPKIGKVDFSPLKGCFGGGDKVPETVKRRFDDVLAAGGGTVELVEGYGLTETVTACTLLPAGQYRKDSIGVPLPGIRAKVVEPDTTEALPVGEEGELCITGPTNMLGYMGRPDETAQAIRRHDDGRDWVHTGDLCSMDADGFIFFKMRLKRMVKVSGIAVYPPQVEETLRQHDLVRDVCVVGVPDPYKMTVVRAYVVPADPQRSDDDAAAAIRDWAADKLNRWSLPRDIVFRDELPLTRVGKVAYAELEKEAADEAEPAAAG